MFFFSVGALVANNYLIVIRIIAFKVRVVYNYKKKDEKKCCWSNRSLLLFQYLMEINFREVN